MIAMMAFLVVTLFFFNPIFFENKSIDQHDVAQGLGGGQEAKEFRATYNEEALWTNSMFGGMPAYLINVAWSGDMLKYAQNLISVWMPSSAQVIFLSLLCFYILLLVFEVRPYLAIAGAIAFAFSSFSIISVQAGHIWKVRAIAYMPLVLAGVHLLFRSKHKLFATALTALAIGLEIKANHLQITYYLFLLMIFYGIGLLVYHIKEKKMPVFIKSIAWLLLALALGIGSNLGNLWATYEYGQYSSRGKSELTQNGGNAKSGLEKDYVFRWSSGKLESMTFLIPNFYGGASANLLVEDKDGATLRALQRAGNPQQAQQLARYTSAYWGEQPGTAPIYAGAVICFLFVLGLLVVQKSTSLWILAATVFSLFLSWGSNFAFFNDLMYEYFPAYNKFRAVTMIVSVTIFCLCLLASLAAEKTLSELHDKKLHKKLFIALGITGGLCLLFLVFKGTFDFQKSYESQLPGWLASAMAEDRAELFKNDIIRSLLFILAAFGILFAATKHKINVTVASLALVVLVSLDLLVVDKRYLNKTHFKKRAKKAFFVASAADQVIAADDAPSFRVVNLLNPWNEAKTSYHHQSVGGYHGAKLKRYQQLIDRCLGEEVNGVIANLQQGKADNKDFKILNMLNTKYFVFGQEKNNVLVNSGAKGNAWLVKSIKSVASADEEIKEVCGTLDLNTAIINTNQFDITSGSYNDQGSVALKTYQPNHLTYEADLQGKGLAVFSEIYYPEGWKAYIDGNEVDILRANFVLRAMEIPKGKHQIEFKFIPKVYAVGNTVMMISSSLLLLLFLGSIVMVLLDKKV